MQVQDEVHVPLCDGSFAPVFGEPPLVIFVFVPVQYGLQVGRVGDDGHGEDCLGEAQQPNPSQTVLGYRLHHQGQPSQCTSEGLTLG